MGRSSSESTVEVSATTLIAVDTPPKLNETESQLEYLNGLRGIGALQVFLLHAKLGGFFDPIPIFYLLSGRVLCLSYLRHRDSPKILASAILRRTFRILGPVLACSLLNWILYTSHAYDAGPLAVAKFPGWETFVGQAGNGEPPKNVPTLVQALVQPFHLLLGNYHLLTYPRMVDWTLPHEMDGSWLVYSLVFVVTYFPGRKFMVYGVLTGILFLLQRWTVMFVVGLAIAEAADGIQSWRQAPLWSRKFFIKYGVGMVVFGMHVTDAVWGFLYGSTVFKGGIDKGLVSLTPSANGEFLWTASPIPGYTQFQNSGFLMGVLILLLVDSCKPVQWVLSTAPFRFLGEIAFSFYLLHPMGIASIGAAVALVIPEGYYKTVVGQLMWAVPTWVVTALVAWVFSRTIDKWSIHCGKLVEQQLAVEM